MAQSNKHRDADMLARELASENPRTRRGGPAARLLEIGRRYRALPVKDARRDDDILGFDDRGMPTRASAWAGTPPP